MTIIRLIIIINNKVYADWNNRKTNAKTAHIHVLKFLKITIKYRC